MSRELGGLPTPRVPSEIRNGVIMEKDGRNVDEELRKGAAKCLQCGLSWDLMLKKRGIFRNCFENFDYNKIASYSDANVERILNTEGMIRSPRKIQAVINNAGCFQNVREEFGSFCEYLWGFSKGKTILYQGYGKGAIPVSNGLSDRIINDHDRECPCYKQIVTRYPTVTKRRDNEVC